MVSYKVFITLKFIFCQLKELGNDYFAKEVQGKVIFSSIMCISTPRKHKPVE